jgi:uncharacterized protein (TIRG00374 family)
MRIQRMLFFYLRLTTSLLLVGFFLSSIDLGRLFRPLAPLSWLYIGSAILLINLDRFLMSYKWNILLRAKGMALPFIEIVRSYYIGTFWGAFLPISVAGDVVRGWRLSRHASVPADIASSVIMERLLGTLSCLFLGLLAATAFATLVAPGTWKFPAVVIASFLLFLGLLVLSLNVPLGGWLKRHLPFNTQRWLAKLTQIHYSYRAYQHHHGPVICFLLWSLLEQCLPIVCAFFVSMALNLNVPFFSLLIFMPLILLLIRLPLSFAGFGINEGLYIYFFSFIGLPSSDAFFFGLAMNILVILSILPGFFYYSLRQDLPIANQIVSSYSVSKPL